MKEKVLLCLFNMAMAGPGILEETGICTYLAALRSLLVLGFLEVTQNILAKAAHPGIGWTTRYKDMTRQSASPLTDIADSMVSLMMLASKPMPGGWNMNRFRSMWILLCIWVLPGCGIGWKEYTIDQVSQVLLEEDLIASTDYGYAEYPGGTQEYNFRDDLLTLPDYHGYIAIFVTRSELKRVTREVAKTMKDDSSTYSEFIKGNVVITIYPELTEEDTARFRRALDALE